MWSRWIKRKKTTSLRLTGNKESLYCINYLTLNRQTFDLIDNDGSGTLEKAELEEWFQMVGAELDLSRLMETLIGDGELTREKFARLMSSSAKSHRRDYDIGDDGEEHSH